MNKKTIQYNLGKIAFYWALKKDYNNQCKNDNDTLLLETILLSTKDNLNYMLNGCINNGIITNLIINNTEVSLKKISIKIKREDEIKLKINYKNLIFEIENYFSLWEKGELIPFGDYIYKKAYNALESTFKLILKEYNEYGKYLKLKQLFFSDVDFTQSLLYLEYYGYISFYKILSLNDDFNFYIHIQDKFIENNTLINIEKIFNSKNVDKNNIEYIIPKNIGGEIIIFDNTDKHIFDLTPTESKIFKVLKSKMKEGGIHLDNIRKITKQPTDEATIKTIRDIQSKIKKFDLKKYIKIRGKSDYYNLILKDK